jgi:hypothetical protein
MENNRLPKLALQYQPHGKRDRVRPRRWGKQDHQKTNDLHMRVRNSPILATFMMMMMMMMVVVVVVMMMMMTTTTMTTTMMMMKKKLLVGIFSLIHSPTATAFSPTVIETARFWFRFNIYFF